MPVPDMKKPDPPQRDNNVTPAWIVNAVIIVILVAWIATLAIRITWPDRALPPVVDALMLMVAGFLFAGNIKNRGGDDK